MDSITNIKLSIIAMIMISSIHAAGKVMPVTTKQISRLIKVPIIKSVQTQSSTQSKSLIGEGGNNALIGESGRAQSQVLSKTLIGEGGKPASLIGEGGKVVQSQKSGK